MVGLNAVARELQGFQRFILARFLRFLDLGTGYPKTRFGKIDAVEPGSQLEQGPVAARGHIGNDASHGRFHVLRSLALDRQQRTKTLGKVGALTIEAKGHGLFLPAVNRMTGQWVMPALASTLRVSGGQTSQQVR